MRKLSVFQNQKSKAQKIVEKKTTGSFRKRLFNNL